MKRKVVIIVVILVMAMGALYLCQKKETMLSTVGIKPEEIVELHIKVERRYREAASLVLQKEDEAFSAFLSYIDTTAKPVSLCLERYRIGPLSVELITENDVIVIPFIIAEGENQDETQEFWLWNDKVYELENETTLLLKGITNMPIITMQDLRDPLYQFFYGNLTYEREQPQKANVTCGDLPVVSQQDYPMASLKKVIEDSDFIFYGTLNQVQTYTWEDPERPLLDEDGSIYDYWGDNPKHLAHVQRPAAGLVKMTFQVQEYLYGNGRAGDIIDVIGEYGPCTGLKSPVTFGVSQRELEFMNQYVVFVKKMDCETEMKNWTADFYCGVMELEEDSYVRPLFNVIPKLLDAYCVPLDEVRSMIGKKR